MATKRQLPRAFYSLHEFAQITGLGYRHVLKLAQADHIPTAKVGFSRTYLIPAQFLDAMGEQTMQHFFQQLVARGLMPAPTASPEEPDSSNHEPA